MLLEIFIIIIALLVTIIFVVIASTLLIQKPKDTSYLASMATNATPQPVLWSENLRNNKSSDDYPPCIELDMNAKRLHTLLIKTKQYRSIIDVISIVLCCMKKRMEKCEDVYVKDRLVQLKGMGADIDDETTKSKAATFIEVNDSLISQFLVAAMNLLDKMVVVYVNDADIPIYEKEQVTAYMANFYRDRFEFIYKQC